MSVFVSPTQEKQLKIYNSAKICKPLRIKNRYRQTWGSNTTKRAIKANGALPVTFAFPSIRSTGLNSRGKKSCFMQQPLI